MRAALAIILMLALTGGCATPRGAPGAMPDITSAEPSAADTEEAGLWMLAARYERDLKTSGALVRDPGLDAFLRSVVCRLVPDQCDSIRIYLLETPSFNASMAPNGTMQVWTGLLLRSRNEDQLAYVLGHEIGHYQRRHTLQQWRDLRKKSNAATVLGLVGALGPVAQFAVLSADIALLGSVLAFSRDQEREADDIGFQLMVNAGYDPREAAKIWEALEQERRAAGKSRPSIFFSTHPPTDERLETLRALGAKADVPTTRVDPAPFRDVVLPHRAAWLRDELRTHEFKGTQVVLDHLRAGRLRPGEIDYFQGELYRLRAEKGDDDKALAAYQQALSSGGAPPETYRALGLLCMKAGNRDEARTAFERYLEARPEAADREMISRYLDQLR
jgi:tetratricopeptide (TPR) repeat protein